MDLSSSKLVTQVEECYTGYLARTRWQSSAKVECQRDEFWYIRKPYKSKNPRPTFYAHKMVQVIPKTPLLLGMPSRILYEFPGRYSNIVYFFFAAPPSAAFFASAGCVSALSFKSSLQTRRTSSLLFPHHLGNLLLLTLHLSSWHSIAFLL